MSEHYLEEQAKYKKKKESNTSKSNKKSKHKHEYIEALGYDTSDNRWRRIEVCKICGKIGNIHFFEADKVLRDGRRVYRMLSDEQISERYRHLPHVKFRGIKSYTIDNLDDLRDII